MPQPELNNVELAVQNDTRLLSPAQERAIEAMMMGAAQKYAARIAGVGENTVSHWMNHVPAFRQELESRRAYERERRIRLIETLVNEALEAHGYLLRGPVQDDPYYSARARLGAVELAYKLGGLIEGRGPGVVVNVAAAATAVNAQRQQPEEANHGDIIDQ